MPENIIKPTGATKASKNDAGGGVIRSEPVIAIVKNNVDPVRQGRIQVFVEDLNGTDPDDSKGWLTVRFMSPFYGKTYGTSGDKGSGEYASNPVSYGEWHSPPDVGTRVICIFVNGDPNYGYYIGCVPEPELLTMVPAIGAIDSKVTMNDGEAKGLAGATQLPVTNLNSNNKSEANSDQFLEATKPVHSYVASVLAQQGLIRDNIRGPITSTAQRETPSRVGWGVSTPGRPIYEGGYTDQTIASAVATSNSQAKVVSRRAGHTFVMDDGDILGKDQLIRLRTTLGHQILMSDDGQCLFIIHANGQSWIELGKEGTIDMFSTNSVNIRTQGDLNLHADNNININAEKNININAKENINVNSDKETAIRTGTNFKQHTIKDYTSKVGGKMSMASTGDGSYASSSLMFVNGSKVNLNTGETSLPPQEVKPIPLIAQTDTLFDKEKGFAPVPGKLQTIVSRAPAHMPWPMANKGVDVKVDLNADTSLPPAPSSAVSATNSTVPSTPSAATTLATAATVPNIGDASKALSAGPTAALVSAAAATASVAAPSALTAGSAIQDGVAKVGQLAQTAEQMVTGGALKPGAETLVNGLIQSGASVTGAMTSALFSGAPGATNITQFINDTTAQVQSQVANFSKAQNQLISAGIISGKEAPGAIAGIVMASAQNGLADAAKFVKTASSVAGQAAAVASQLGDKVNSVAQNISAGNFASNMATNVSGALGGVAGALGSALDNAKGVAASAFNSIVSSYKSFKPNVPQDLKAIAEGVSETASNAISSVTGAAASAAGALQSASSGLSGATSAITNVAAQAASMTKNLASSMSGLQGIPGGINTISSVINNAKGAISQIPGAGGMSAMINNVTTGNMNNIASSVAATASQATSIASGAIGTITGAGAITAAAAGAQSIISSAQNMLNSGSLASAATSLLPKDLAAQLNSAINAISSSGPTQIKLPTIAENTLDRGGFAAQVDSIIGNPKIPVPNYGSSATAAVATYYEQENKKLEEIQKKKEEVKKLERAQFQVAMDARTAFEDALNNLPEGDPGINAARTKFHEERMKWTKLSEELIALIVAS